MAITVYFVYTDYKTSRFGRTHSHHHTANSKSEALGYAHRVIERAKMNANIDMEEMVITDENGLLWAKDYCNLAQRSVHLPATL